jgi:hypothetical protein
MNVRGLVVQPEAVMLVHAAVAAPAARQIHLPPNWEGIRDSVDWISLGKRLAAGHSRNGLR